MSFHVFCEICVNCLAFSILNKPHRDRKCYMLASHTKPSSVQRTANFAQLIADTLCLQGTETLTEASAKRLLLQWQDVKAEALGMSRADARLAVVL